MEKVIKFQGTNSKKNVGSGVRYGDDHNNVHAKENCDQAYDSIEKMDAELPEEGKNGQTQQELLPIVTGRKAARSLRLFRSHADHNIESLIELPGTDPENEQTTEQESSTGGPNNDMGDMSSLKIMPDVKTKAITTKLTKEENDKLVGLEPVSSATYFPHTPADQKFVQYTIVDTSGPERKTQHLTADLEFDHSSDGDITKIQKRKTPMEESPPDQTDKMSETLDNVRISNKQDTNKSVKFDTKEVYQPVHAEDTTPNEEQQEANIDDQELWNEGTIKDEFPLAVELRPFKNKVGGHTAIFRFSRRAVCKALMNRENLWYEAVELSHPELLRFMPKYIGVLNVRYSSIITEDSLSQGPSRKNSVVEENLSNSRKKDYSFGAPLINEDDELPPEVVLDDNKHIIPELLWKQYSSSAPSPNGSLIQKQMSENSLDASSSFKNSVSSSNTSMSNVLIPVSPRSNEIGSTSVNTDLQAQVIQEVFSKSQKKKKIDHCDEIFTMDDENPISDMDANETVYDIETGHNLEKQRTPTTQHSSSFSSLKHQVPLLRKHTRFERFILLEDLTADMQKPCVLDLKMGTRQYGIEANPSKQKSQRNKCLNTTSRSLGVRICGLQVWDTKAERFFMKDKYFGRKVTKGTDFCKVLSKFLYDGMLVYSIVIKIPKLIMQLQELYQIFKTLADYRMYGSSILLMYDGLAHSDDIKVRIIDFAQSVIAEESLPHSTTIPPANTGLPDKGYLRGLESLISYFKIIFRLLTGADYNDYGLSQSVVESRKFALQNTPNPWLDLYGEDVSDEDTADIPHNVSDDFNCQYPAYSYSDEEGISE